MAKFSPFRVSFDGPLPRGERRRAKIAAVIIGGAVLIFGFAGIRPLLNASSGLLAAWSNAQPGAEAQILDPKAAAATSAKAGAGAARATPKVPPADTSARSEGTTGVASRETVEPVRSAAGASPTSVSAPQPTAAGPNAAHQRHDAGAKRDQQARQQRARREEARRRDAQRRAAARRGDEQMIWGQPDYPSRSFSRSNGPAPQRGLLDDFFGLR